MSTSDTAGAAGEGDLVATLSAAEESLERAKRRVEEFGETELDRLAEAHEEFVALLDRYEERVTGDSDFETFIEFQGNVETLVGRFPDDLLLAEAFEECDDHLQQRRLSESDFEHVRSQLEPVADLVARLDERERALEEYRQARRAVRRRARELDDQIEELRRLERLGDADLDAPTERLRDPIETYNRAVTEAFETFWREAPAREVFSFLAATTAYPLVSFPAPPEDLREYVETRAAGTEPVPTLLEYAGYSRSKLDHYVADADALKRTVATRQTYLRRLDADPLTVGWPPPEAGLLRWRCRELTSVVNRLEEHVVEPLRDVAALPRDTDYERLREAAIAESELTAAERERLRTGAVSDDLSAAVTQRDRLRTALAEYPER
jgi:hypothetical protein